MNGYKSTLFGYVAAIGLAVTSFGGPLSVQANTPDAPVGTPKQVNYQGISFSYDSGLTDNVVGKMSAEDWWKRTRLPGTSRRSMSSSISRVMSMRLSFTTRSFRYTLPPNMRR